MRCAKEVGDVDDTEPAMELPRTVVKDGDKGDPLDDSPSEELVRLNPNGSPDDRDDLAEWPGRAVIGMARIGIISGSEMTSMRMVEPSDERFAVVSVELAAPR